MDERQANFFPSVAALRAAHNALLQRHREQGDAPALFTEIEHFLAQGRASGALIDSEEERWAAQSLLDYWSATLLSAGRQPADALLVEFDATSAPTLADDLCPYVGLNAFGEKQNPVFFGRQRLAAELLEKLTQERLLVVVGPSGSGKSSLVLAGLLPALKGGAIPATVTSPASHEWRYLPRLVPGSDPLGNLARAVQPAKTTGTLDINVTAKFAFAADGFRREATFLLDLLNGPPAPSPPLTVEGDAATGHPPVVLVIDQFEELFTLCSDGAARQALVDNLLALTQAPGPRHTVILTMRTDFESFVARLTGFQNHFEQALVRVTPLNAAELREAIEKPAALIGLKFEDGLVDALLQDILGEPAALPLLQFTLLRLWENRERNRITWAAYKRLGGGRLALANSADELYNALIPEEQLTTRRILMRLVRPGEGLEITSNRVRRAVLYQTGEARDRVDRVLQKLIDAHLLRVSEGDSSADTQIEVAHEALVRNWPRLVTWLEEERETLRERVRLTEAAEQWLKLNRDPSALLRGTLLEEAQRRSDLNEVEQEFVKASQAARLAVEQEKEAARQREIEQAQALAEIERERAETERQRAETERQWSEFQEQTAARLRQHNLSLRIVSAVAVLVAIAAVWAGLAAWWQRQEAVTSAAIAKTALTELSIKQNQIVEATIQASLAQATTQAVTTAYVEVKSTVVANSTVEAELSDRLRGVLGVFPQVAGWFTDTVPTGDAATPTPPPRPTALRTPTRVSDRATPPPTPTKQPTRAATVILPGAGVKAKLWQPGQTLRIRFVDGEADLHQRVQTYALEWTQYANLHFAFTSDPAAEADVRISFAEPGAWSYVGTDARVIAQSQPTMGLGWLTTISSEEEFKRIVLREFGHMLGMINEFQNPNANIPWDRDAVYAKYTAPPQNLSRAQIDAVFFTQYSPDLLAVPKPFDPQSIMMFPVPAEFTKDSLAIGWNNELSALDKRVIAQLYP